MTSTEQREKVARVPTRDEIARAAQSADPANIGYKTGHVIADAIIALLSAPQDRDVGDREDILHKVAEIRDEYRVARMSALDQMEFNAAQGNTKEVSECSTEAERHGAALLASNRILNLLSSTPPSVAVIPDGLAKLLEDVAPTIHALRHYTTNDLKPGEMPGNILLLSDAVAVIALYDALSASPSPALNRTTGESLEAEEKEMFRLADRLGYVCTPEPHPDSPHVQEQEETRIAIKDEARREMATIAANCEIKFSPARSGQLADQIELARGGIAKAILNTIGQP